MGEPSRPREGRGGALIGHVATDELEGIAKRVMCAHCRKAVIPHEETDRGALCRKSVESSTEIWVSFVIDGVTYRKLLKGRLSVVDMPKKTRAGASTPARKEA